MQSVLICFVANGLYAEMALAVYEMCWTFLQQHGLYARLASSAYTCLLT